MIIGRGFSPIYCLTNSTRRFFARPSSVSLAATGRELAAPVGFQAGDSDAVVAYERLENGLAPISRKPDVTVCFAHIVRVTHDMGS